MPLGKARRLKFVQKKLLDRYYGNLRFLFFLTLLSLDIQDTCRRAMPWTHEQAREHGVFPWPVGDMCLDIKGPTLRHALTPLFRIDSLNVVHM